MEWMESISKAVAYMEKHITDDITAETVVRDFVVCRFDEGCLSILFPQIWSF